MPGTHGRELVRRLRALLPNAAIIVCSGFILEDEEIPEIDSLVVKPFNPTDLIRMLGNMVAQRSAAPS
jgi:CheY-like chemotaxis protein